MTRVALRFAVATTAAALTLSALPERFAEACGAFFARPSVPIERRPSLAVERVLIIHDAEKQVQHFIREVSFRGSNEPFGFVVPTPTRPDVFKVNQSPFDKLEQAFPFEPPRAISGGDGSKGASRSAPGGGAPQVMILDIKKVGSFTAFVLAANDATALGKWLKDNGLASSPENDAWLDGYVKRSFFYVAFRYDPKESEKGAQQPRSETMRISFQTPLAYYPYREPAHEGDSVVRDVGLWVASNERLVPVALAEEDGQAVWVKPFAEGWTREGTSAETLKASLGAEEDKLLSQSSYTLQPFEDQKLSRKGYGDVVFLPAKGVPPERRQAAAAMLELLRTTTVGGAK